MLPLRGLMLDPWSGKFRMPLRALNLKRKKITENVKLLEENIGRIICDHGLGSYLLDMTFNA